MKKLQVNEGHGLFTMTLLAVALASTIGVAACSNPLTAAINAAGTAAASPKMAISYASGTSLSSGGSLAFSGTSVGSSSTIILTLTNSGKTDLAINLSGITFTMGTGTEAATFTLKTLPPVTIAAGQSSTCTLAFSPSAAGAKTATVVIPTNDVTTPKFSFTISGTAISSNKAISAYAVLVNSNPISGIILGTNINVTVPNGTSLTNLVATFTYTGVSIAIGSNPQISGTTPNNFTTPQTYTVSAADGTTQNYTVTVTAATAILGSQSGTIVSGYAATATFAATTTYIPNGTAGTITWYTSLAGTTTTGAPTWITPTVSTVASNSSTVTMTASTAAVAGSYFFTVTFGPATSTVATLTVIQPTAILGSQSGTIVSGYAATATFAATTAYIPNGTAGTITWYTSLAGTTTGAPTWITPTVSTVASNSSTVTMTASTAAVAGSYYFTTTFASAVSSIATLTVLQPTVSLGVQSGTITSGTAGSATFAATTTNIATGTSGTVAWYSDSAGTIPTSAPTGITRSVTNVASNTSTVTMTASTTALVGLFYFTVSFGSTVSAVATLSVTWNASDLTSANIGTLKAVPGGTFYNGTANMTVSSYHLGQYDITRAQFLSVMGTDPSTTANSTGTSDPVQNVNWYHAIAFCNKLSLLEGKTPVYSVSGVSDWAALAFASIPTTPNATNWIAATATWTNNGYRLPTEMEYMWAAIGGASDTRSGDIVGGVNTGGYTKGYAGSQELLGAVVNVDNYAWHDTTTKTHPVGTKTGNELGLYDISGNVFQWCWDSDGSYPGATTDYRGASSDAIRVRRGGSWFYPSSYLACALRSSYYSYYQGPDDGFRVVAP